ncbi:ester cyclase [Modestobacter excelsi]|uniref:ester cyclase n=1 Tax=Modestobacter excelsi TaxID=2213161 RepID=UPI00110CFACE|nr:ester cyclase [Modestobacter excelsi]
MGVETTRPVMDEYLHALIGGQDFGRFFAPDVVWTTMETGETVRGREAVRDLIVAIHTQAFRASPELVQLMTGEGSAMVEAVFDGTHVGDFGGVAATGRHVRMPYCMAYDVSGDVITALRSYFPMAAISAQLTAASRSAGAPA